MSIRLSGEVQKDSVFIFRNTIRYPMGDGGNNSLLIQQEDPQSGNLTQRDAEWLPCFHFSALQSPVFNQPVFKRYAKDRNTESFNILLRVRAWQKSVTNMRLACKPKWIAVWCHSQCRSQSVPPSSLLASSFTRRCRMSTGQILALRTSPLADQWCRAGRAGFGCGLWWKCLKKPYKQQSHSHLL